MLFRIQHFTVCHSVVIRILEWMGQITQSVTHIAGFILQPNDRV